MSDDEKAADWGSAQDDFEDADDDADWGDFEDDADNVADAHDAGGAGDIFVQVENLFYEAEDNRRRNPAVALEQFERCIELEKENGATFSKRFKALEHIVALNFQLGRHDAMLARLHELMEIANDAHVTSNDRSQAVNAILNAISESDDLGLVLKVYDLTLRQLKQLGNQDRLYFTVASKLCRSHLARNDLGQAEALLQDLHAGCQLADGSDDRSKGAELLEVYALKVQLLEAQNDGVKLKELFARTKDLSAEIRDPRSMSVIQECWGKLYASEGLWDQAYTEFWDAFLQFQQIGHDRARACLKYVVLSAMMSSKAMNPFDATEAKAYQSDPEIEELMALREAYDSSDIRKFLAVLRSSQTALLSDAFMKRNVEPLLREIRGKSLLHFIKPYKRVFLKDLGRMLNISADEAEELVVKLILDGQIQGRIDQVNGILNLQQTSSEAKYDMIAEWASKIETIYGDVVSSLAISF